MANQSHNPAPNRRQFFATVGMGGVAAAIPATAAEPTNEVSFTLQRQQPIESGYDVVVLGGGPGGCGAVKGMRNLWVTGRCHSSDIKVHGAIHGQPGCLMMGQAAGTAAVQSCRTGEPACDLNIQTLVESLRKQNVYLPQQKTSETMTRS